MLYGFVDQDGTHINLEYTAPLYPIVKVFPTKDPSESVPLQCFPTASAAGYHLRTMRDRYLKFADDFDALSITWYDDKLFLSTNFCPNIVED